MAGPDVAGYAKTLVDELGLSADPRAVEVIAAANDVQTAIATAAGWPAALTRWRGATQQLLGPLRDRIGEMVPLPGIEDLVASFPFDRPDGLSLDLPLGPLAVAIDGAVLLAQPPGAADVAVVIGPMLPSRVTGELDAGPLQGGGSLEIVDDGLRGVMEASLGVIGVTVLGSLRQTKSGSASLLAVLGVSFTPGIQVGFGFALNRVGGLVGVNRRADVDALTARLRDGTAADVLFPSDAVAAAPRLLPALDAMFPVRDGSDLVGPTFQVSWLKITDDLAFVTLDLGVVVELPGPSRILIAGSAKAGIPGPVPLLKLRLDLLGGIDLEQKLVFFDASLVDSHVAIVFALGGDAAFRVATGERPYALLSLGGFYPGFNPEPAHVPVLRRLSMSLDLPVPIPGLDFSASGYFAVTSNTLQLGAHCDVSFGLGIYAVGSFGFDALIQFEPFHFTGDFSAGFHVEVLGFSFGGVRLDGKIDGPGPITISGRLTVETFLKDVSWNHTFQIGDAQPAPAILPRSLLKALQPELDRHENLHGSGGSDPLVAVRPRALSKDAAGKKIALVSPLGGLRWEQRRAPLDLPIDRLEGAPLGSTQGVRADCSLKQDDVHALFSPGSFITLAKAEALNKPAFEDLHAGIAVAWGGDKQGTPAKDVPTDRQIVCRVGQTSQHTLVVAEWLLPAGAVLGMIADRALPPAVTSTAPKVALVRELWMTSNGGTYDSATAAHQDVRGGGLALPAADLARPLDLSAV